MTDVMEGRWTGERIDYAQAREEIDRRCIDVVYDWGIVQWWIELSLAQAAFDYEYARNCVRMGIHGPALRSSLQSAHEHRMEAMSFAKLLDDVGWYERSSEQSCPCISQMGMAVLAGGGR